MHANSAQTALMYVAIILGVYALGMVILLVHHVHQKHGQISLYDIYLEIWPACWTTSSQGNNAQQLVHSRSQNKVRNEAIPLHFLEEFSKHVTSFLGI